MSDNSPESIEEIANYLRSADVVGFSATESVRIVVGKLRAAAALARENAELRESFIASGCAIHETGTDVYVQNARAESAESANRSLQAEVDRLRMAVTKKNQQLNCAASILRLRNEQHEANCCAAAIAYTGTETPSEETP